MSRLVVETPAWLQKKPKMIEDKYESEKVVERKIEALKERVGFRGKDSGSSRVTTEEEGSSVEKKSQQP